MRVKSVGVLLLLALLTLLPKTLCAKAAGNMLEHYLYDPRLAEEQQVLALVEITRVSVDFLPKGGWFKTGTLTLRTLESVGGALPRTLQVPFQQRTAYNDQWTWDFVELAPGRHLLGFFNHWNGRWVVTADGATGVISNVEKIRPKTLRRVQRQFKTPILPQGRTRLKAVCAKANSLVYTLHVLAVADTNPNEYVWLVEGGPDIAYKSLDSPSLHLWVGQLPKGTEIDYRLSSLPFISTIFKNSKTVKGYRNPEAGLPEFKRFCQSKGVHFEDGFPVL